jgi:hypothetical protein
MAMREPHRNRTWFAQLRRDRLLFALVAAFLVFSHALTPLAAAQDLPLDLAGTICRPSADDAASAQLPSPGSAHDHRAHCVAGPCAGLALDPRVEPAGTIVLLPASGSTHAAPYANRVLRTLFAAPPPAIRAPPVLL